MENIIAPRTINKLAKISFRLLIFFSAISFLGLVLDAYSWNCTSSSASIYLSISRYSVMALLLVTLLGIIAIFQLKRHNERGKRGKWMAVCASMGFIAAIVLFLLDNFLTMERFCAI